MEPSINPENLIALGRISRTQGHLGAVRLVPYYEPPEQIEKLRTKELILIPRQALSSTPGTFRSPQQLPHRILHIRELSYHQECVIISFEEIADMTQAEALREMEVYVREEQLWPLPEDQYYPHQLLGLQVVDAAQGTPLGSVSDVRTGGVNDYLVVQRQGAKPFLVPLVGTIVKKVDLKTGQILVELPPGLLEL